jgi:hypothetical protein
MRRENIGETNALAGEPSGAKSQRTRYDGTRGGVSDLLTEDRAWGVFSYEARLPLCADSNKIPHRTEVTRCANSRHRMLK